MIHTEIDTLIKEHIQSDRPGAAVAVVKNGEIIHQSGYGLANVEWEIPITEDTVFKIASITKTFTAAAIMMLVEQDKIALDASINQYLPDYHTAGHHITISNLLNHSSGIHNYSNPLPGDDIATKFRRSVTPEQIVQEFSGVPFDFKPGSKADYSNSNYVLLSQIVEKISVQPYEDFVQENILNPLGMKNTYFLDEHVIYPQKASGYFNGENSVTPVPYLDISWTHGSGCMGSTLTDLIRWDAAIREGALLNSETWDVMFTPLILEDGTPNYYGYSWSVTDYETHPVTFHSGNLPGFRLLLARFPQDNLSVIVLSNYDGDGVNPYKIGTLIARHMLDLPKIKRRPFILAGDSIGKVIGHFQHIQITTDEGKFYALLHDPFVEPTRLRLMPLNSRQFYNTDYPEEIFSFAEEQNGVFTKLTLTTPLKPEKTFKRTRD